MFCALAMAVLTPLGVPADVLEANPRGLTGRLGGGSIENLTLKASGAGGGNARPAEIAHRDDVLRHEVTAGVHAIP